MPEAPIVTPTSPGGGPVGTAERCVHRVFEAQARRRSSAIAVVHDGRTMTFEELDRRANELAARLRAMGVGRETRVGVCVERSFDSIIALLASLKAGAAYLPLDPSYPRKRLAFMLQDAKPAVVLTHRSTCDAVADLSVAVLVLDDDATAPLRAHDDDRQAGETSADDVAYMIYTSGSTGTPKGALITHGNVLGLIEGAAPVLALDERDVWAFMHSVSFDVSVWEIFGALLFGGCVVIVPFAVSRSPAALLSLLSEARVTVVSTTPSIVLALIAADEERGGATTLALRLLMFGGEPLDPARLKPWFDRRGDQRPRLVNLYGITETTVVVTYRPLTIRDAEQGGRSRIGMPLPGFHVHLLDAALQPVPDGEPGEIFVGGTGVGRGYWDRPEVTAQRFLRDPFSPDEGAKLYRSGDLARRLPDGDLEFIGRIDDQVKIRGFRVETGEVEAMLRQHPAVRSCVVRAYTHAENDARLAAYVVPESPALASDGEEQARADGARQLRTFLDMRLPAYMVPSTFTFISAIPLTPNGKIDAAALPAPTVSSATSGLASTQPRTALEEQVAAMFVDLLGAQRVGLHDDFFELGGDSLIAMHLAVRVAERYGLDLEIAMQIVLEHRTVEALARQVEAWSPATRETVTGDRRWPSAPTPAAAAPRYPLSFAQEAVLTTRNLSSERRLNVYGVSEIYEPVEPARLERACRELIARHEILRTSFDVEHMSQHVTGDAAFALPVQDCSLEQAAERRKTFVEPFVLGKAPLMRAELLRLPDGRSHLLLDLHHAITDAVSLPIMMSELWSLYAGRALDPVALHYKDYAVWQRRLADEGAFARDEAFWQRTAADLVWTALPAHPGETASPFSQSVTPVHAELRARVQAACVRQQLTEMTIMLAAIAATVSSYTHQDDITFGLIVSRRSSAALERMLGLFVEDVAYRVVVPDPNDAAEVTRRAAAALAGVLEHPMYPYERLNETCQQRRPTPNGELFSLIVNWLPPVTVSSAAVRTRFMTMPRQSGTKHYLSLRLRDEGSLHVDAKYRTAMYSDEFVRTFVQDILRAADRMATHLCS